MERAQGLRLVGRERPDDGTGRWSVHDSPTSRPPSRRPTGRSPAPRVRRQSARGRVHHAERRQGLAVRAVRPGRRPAAHALRARRVAQPNLLYRQQANPGARSSRRPGTGATPPTSDVYPYAFTTYRLTEHTHGGGMSRTLPYLPSCSPSSSSRSAPSWPRSGAWRTAGGPRWSAPARPSRPGAGHRAHAPAEGGGGPGRAPDRRPVPLGRAGLSTGDSGNDLFGVVMDPQRAHPGEQGRHLRHPARPPSAGPGAGGVRGGLPAACRGQERPGPGRCRSPVEETNMTGEDSGAETTQSAPDHTAEGTS